MIFKKAIIYFNNKLIEEEENQQCESSRQQDQINFRLYNHNKLIIRYYWSSDGLRRLNVIK